MYVIQLCLLLFGISVYLCLPPDYIEIGDDDDDDGGGGGVDDGGSSGGGGNDDNDGSGGNNIELNWDESNELNANQTDIPNNIESNESITETMLISQNENATNKLKIAIDETHAVDPRILELSAVLKATIHRIRQQYKKMDIIFLIDSSSSIGKSNFRSELRFVIKFLSDFNVSYNYTRVSILTFSSQEKIVRHVDHISEADAENDKCKLLNFQVPAIDFTGGGTHTADALKQAKSILTKARRHSKKIICLITDGFSNGEDPMPIADKLKADNVTIITFGIQSGNFDEIYQLSSEPENEHSFLLSSFAQFESLARKALHTDYKIGNAVRIRNSSLCDTLCDMDQMDETSKSCCDKNAACTCHTSSGHYSCTCEPGYYGSGLLDNCQLCPNGTYWHSWNLCKPCSDINHVTSEFPALNASYCVCKSGFKADQHNRCEILRCPMLRPPENGYFVKHPLGCDRVLNTACGARCKSGYQLIGSSIRLCQDNGTWSGTEAKCVLKTCPKLPVPFYGMATCKNTDLNLFFDYTPRNVSFMEFYNDEDLRTTELMPIDTDCKFKCGPGFYMIGSATRNCLPLSKWDGLQTACKQIMCFGLPEVAFGYYDPTDCNQKVVHGSNCTLMCAPGFEVKGPAVKTCGGKKSGVWSNRNKQPKCVDVMPPTLICPENFSVPMLDDDDIAIVKIIPPPNVTDNSDDNITYWLKPSVKEDGVKLTLGTHTFSYIAVDAFRNKAKCNFNITVLDVTAPNIDNCINPPTIFIPSKSIQDNRTFVDWDAPIIYDNSNIDVNVTQTLLPGHIGIGAHSVTYIAIDSSDNQNTCTLNITVNAMECGQPISPENGQIMCARNDTHTWCDIICDSGYTTFEANDEQIDHMRLFCENEMVIWSYDAVPDCTKIELPDSIEQVFSITLDDDMEVCRNDTNLSSEMLQNLLTSQIRQQLCDGLDDCEIVSEIPDCNDIMRNTIDSDASDDETTNRNFYTIVKRDTHRTQFTQQSQKNSATMKIKVYTKISKGLGLWNQSLSRAENLEIVRSELKTYETNERLRQQLNALRINVKHLNLEENLLCHSGAVLKRSNCVQCPRGTFHNKALNSCQLCKIGYYNDREGQVDCMMCPKYQSTRKLGAKSKEECIEQCPPGTMARLRLRTNQKYQNSLMPFCRKCNPSQYQPNYNQIKCMPCPLGMSSPRGAISITNCFSDRKHICEVSTSICGPHGVCVPENGNQHLYSCLCENGYTGSHCEHLIDVCASEPCHNNGQCNQINSTNFVCNCVSERFSGDQCEIENSSCSSDYCGNFGTCIETDRKPVCECAPGYAGELCEIRQNFCSNNPCESGQCLNSATGFICKCPPAIIGRRCHLRPCDYLPCHDNAQCVDLPVLGATRRSYRCVCPKGLKGDTCTQVKNACESNPCKNNGFCTPFALRNINTLHANEEIDENIYDRYTCKCPPYFYGASCETFVSPDYVLEFTKPGVHNYVKLNGPIHDLNEISFCTWIQTNDSFNYGTIFSYATESIDNMFTLTDYNGIVLYVHGKNAITDITVNDGEWHFICTTWSSLNGKFDIYIDGILRDAGTNLSTNLLIEANGTIIVGQEQDSIGSSFSDSESFVGRIAYTDIWDRRISAEEMFEFYTTCEPYQGNLYTWSDFRAQIFGAVKIVRSPFCKRCSQNLILKNGYIRYLSNRAFHYCADGYKIHGPTIRNCLRTSKWSLPVPYCRSIHCHLPNLLNGQITIEKSNIGEMARYSCNDNYYLSGSSIRYCLNNGTWSHSHPECISLIHCEPLKPPQNGLLIYANEHGRIDSRTNYPMGTFVEVHCMNDTVVKGEGFLSCIDSGIWDFPVPECIPIPITTTTIPTTTTIANVLPTKSVAPITTSTTKKSITVKTTATTKKTTVQTTKSTTTTTTMRTTVKTTKTSSTTTPPSPSPRITTTTTKKPATKPSKPRTEVTTSTMATLQYDTVPVTIVTMPSTTKTTTKSPPPSTSLPSPKPFEVNRLPDKQFWNHLKQLYYYGCNNAKVRPFLCQILNDATQYSDLTQFELPETSDFKHMDQNLLVHLTQAEHTLNQRPDIDLNIEKMLPFILYGNDKLLSNEKKMPSNMANGYRFVLCLYIDTILLDKNLNLSFVQHAPIGDENVTQKLKYFLVRIASKVFANQPLKLVENYDEYAVTLNNQPLTVITNDQSLANISNVGTQNRLNENDSLDISSTVATEYIENPITSMELQTISIESDELHVPKNNSSNKLRNSVDSILESEPVDESCQLESLPETLSNSFIREIKIDNETIFNMPDRLYLIGPVSIRTRAYLACSEGYRSRKNSIHYFECNESLKWIGEPIQCEAITCAKPTILNAFTFNSRIAKNVYFYGQKLQLKCNRGYELKGEPYLQCLATGEWSRNISNCSRISCSKPELPDNANILHGSSYLYSDKVVILCGNGEIVENYCNADGQWLVDLRQACHG